MVWVGPNRRPPGSSSRRATKKAAAKKTTKAAPSKEESKTARKAAESPTLRKSDLVEGLAVREFGGNRRQAGRALEYVLEAIAASVARGEKVAITGFGVFEKVERNARTARDPRTGERIRVKRTSAPRFRAGTEFKAYVSGAKKVAKAPAGKAAAKKSPAKRSAAKTTAKKAIAEAAPTKKTRKKTTAKKATGKHGTG